MQIGGLYCCGGEGFSGKYFSGTLDEVRVWSRALKNDEIAARMDTPLYAGDEDKLLFYFPMDEAGMEMGANVVESKALYWYGILGNALGGGRPVWTDSGSPLTCAAASKAPPCVKEADVGFTGFLPVTATKRSYSFSTAVVLVLFAAALAAALASISTYASITGDLPPALGNVCSACAGLLPFGYTRASAGPMDRPGDWTWANPPREVGQPTPKPTGPPAKRSYGGV